MSPPRPSTLAALALVLGLASAAQAQTARTVDAALQDLASTIPGTCTTTCAEWVAALGDCPATASSTANAALFETCACTETFVALTTTCLNCFTTDESDTLTELNTYCGLAVSSVATSASATASASDVLSAASSASDAVVTSSALTSSVVTSAAATATATTASSSTSYHGRLSAVTTTSTNSTTSTTSTPTSSSVSDLSSSATTPAGPITVTSIIQGAPFPTQSVGANAFTGAAGRVGASAWGTACALMVAMVVGAGLW